MQLHCPVWQIQFTHPLRNTPTRQSSVLAFLRSLERGLTGPRGNPRSTWRNKRWGGRLSGSPRQLVEMCLLISSCCSTSGLRSWDLFSEHFGIRQTRLPPASQLNPFAIWLMIKRVMVYTERAVKDAVCEQDRQVSKPEQQTVQSAEPQVGSAKSPGFQIQCPLQRELKSVCAPCLALSLSSG